MNVKLSEDLTLVLIRANGSPRTFNLPVPRLKRNLLLITGVLTVLLVTALTFSSLYVFDNFIASKPPLLTADDAAKLESVRELEQEITNLQNALSNKKNLTLAPGDETAAAYPLQLLGPLSVRAAKSPVEIEEPKVIRDAEGKGIRLTFNIINKFPDQQKVRGYIVVLAKTPDGVKVYPDGAFSPEDSILLTYNAGETFGISRFRSSEAKFKDLDYKLNEIGFHILLFSYTGEILNSMHVPGAKI